MKLDGRKLRSQGQGPLSPVNAVEHAERESA